MHSTKVFVRGTDELQEIEKEEWSFIIIITFMGRTKTGFMMLFFSIVLCKYTLATCTVHKFVMKRTILCTFFLYKTKKKTRHFSLACFNDEFLLSWNTKCVGLVQKKKEFKWTSSSFTYERVITDLSKLEHLKWKISYLCEEAGLRSQSASCRLQSSTLLIVLRKSRPTIAWF